MRYISTWILDYFQGFNWIIYSRLPITKFGKKLLKKKSNVYRVKFHSVEQLKVYNITRLWLKVLHFERSSQNNVQLALNLFSHIPLQLQYTIFEDLSTVHSKGMQLKASKYLQIIDFFICEWSFHRSVSNPVTMTRHPFLLVGKIVYQLHLPASICKE